MTITKSYTTLILEKYNFILFTYFNCLKTSFFENIEGYIKDSTTQYLSSIEENNLKL